MTKFEAIRFLILGFLGFPLYHTSASFSLGNLCLNKNVSILLKVVLIIHFSLRRAEKCLSIHCYLAFGILGLITYLL